MVPAPYSQSAWRGAKNPLLSYAYVRNNCDLVEDSEIHKNVCYLYRTCFFSAQNHTKKSLLMIQSLKVMLCCWIGQSCFYTYVTEQPESSDNRLLLPEVCTNNEGNIGKSNMFIVQSLPFPDSINYVLTTKMCLVAYFQSYICVCLK